MKNDHPTNTDQSVPSIAGIEVTELDFDSIYGGLVFAQHLARKNYEMHEANVRQHIETRTLSVFKVQELLEQKKEALYAVQKADEAYDRFVNAQYRHEQAEREMLSGDLTASSASFDVAHAMMKMAGTRMEQLGEYAPRSGFFGQAFESIRSAVSKKGPVANIADAPAAAPTSSASIGGGLKHLAKGIFAFGDRIKARSEKVLQAAAMPAEAAKARIEEVMKEIRATGQGVRAAARETIHDAVDQVLITGVSIVHRSVLAANALEKKVVTTRDNLEQVAEGVRNVASNAIDAGARSLSAYRTATTAVIDGVRQNYGDGVAVAAERQEERRKIKP